MSRGGASPVLFVVFFGAGLILGVLGTVLHGNLYVLDVATTTISVPWGAVLGLIIVFLGALWAGTFGGSVAAALTLGATSFTVATAAYLWPGADQLVIAYSPEAFEVLPGPVLASALWWLGTGVVTFLAMLGTRIVLNREQR